MINSQINILAQAEDYLRLVTSEQYRQVISPLFSSSSGQHIRHVLDHYVSIIKGISTGLVDYDKRNRGGKVESDIEEALVLISEIKLFLLSLTAGQLSRTIQLSTEVNIECKQVALVNTTLARELVFVGGHAIHHFAMVEQISKAQNLTTPSQFGIAPSTATFIRDKQCAR